MKSSFICLTSFLLGAAGFAFAADSVPSFSLGAGVVVDASREAVYYADGKFAMHKRAIRDGKLAWTSGEQGLPIAIIGGALLAQIPATRIGEGRLLWINAASGKAGARFTVTLPNDVMAGLGPRANQHFEITPEVSGSQLLLHWRYSFRPLRGAVSENDEAEEISRSGLIALSAGASTAESREASGRVAPRLVYSLSADEQLSNQSGHQFRASDDRHVLASEGFDDPQFATRYRWRILDRSSGAALGQIESIQSMAPFFVEGSTLVMRATRSVQTLADGRNAEFGERLIGFDLKTGVELWSANVLDSAYRGLLPP